MKSSLFFFQDHELKDDSISHLFEIPPMQSMGYLARAVVNDVLKEGQLMTESESCKIS